MAFDFADIVVVPFPFLELPVAKRRPALVLSATTFNDANDHSVLAMITTAARSAWPSDLPIADLAAAGLQRTSVVRWKLFTLPNGLIERRLGRLGEADRSAAERGLRTIFAGG